MENAIKKEVHPLVLVAVAVVMVALLGYLAYRTFGVRTVDSFDTLSPEVKAKINGAYGGGGGARSAPPAPRR